LLILGSEADIVVCFFSHTHRPSLRRDLDFLYNRPRLNVAISRAKLISIVVSSEGVLNPPVEALVDKNNLEGFSYLKSYETYAWGHEQAFDESDLPSEKPHPALLWLIVRPTFSSQEYEDEGFVETVLELLENASEHKDIDPELAELMGRMAVS
jgi:hypothetical protein